MNHSKIILAAVAALSATPALAQDEAPFAGPRASAEAGWGRVGGKRVGGDGFSYGATLGYDIAAGSARIGPEIGVADSTQKECRPAPTIAAGASRCGRSDRDLYAGARLGYVAAPRLLVFGRAGYTNARFADRIERASAPRVETAEDRGGYRFGAGVEYALGRTAFVTGEYRYSHWSGGIHLNQVLAGVGVRF